MAKEDYEVADRNIEALEAGDKVAETVADTPEAGVEGTDYQSAYVNYAAALTAHEGRADIESLADRRSREAGTTYAETDFMRADAYDANGDAVAPPRPGTVHGDAPESA